MPVSRATFWVGRRLVRAGDHVDPTDEVLDGRGHLFVPDANPVEQATAAPGEVRATSHVCDVCKFVSKSAAGLAAHQRSHD